ncbi:ABC transporter permease [Actinomadura kijaniata]|uniref:Transport permease protein n=1 Tax=Actinomadura namibiensis TaxID=182080 RepID=A0A7W3LYU0_ACTNM|nr:ABC transporter permease [Actinomadura namibiensis]MBA8956693.1 teichoic acid transport system permease protein [Actinomadura namibiensis]
MSHPERLSSAGGDPAGTITEPPRSNGMGSVSLAEFAARHGLTRSAARPRLRAYVQELWQRRTFIWNFASAKTAATYSGSRLGQVWQVLTPLLNAGVYFLIFGLLLSQSKGIENYTAFLITGVFVFTFSQRSLTAGAKSVSNNLSLIRALHFPRAALPFAYVIMELQQLLISMIVLAVVVVATGEMPTWHWLLLFPALALQLLFNVGISLAIARVGAFTRDIQQLLPFITRTWLYVSGVFFLVADKVKALEERGHGWLGHILEANPGAVFIELVRDSIMHESYRATLAKAGAAQPTMLWVYAVVWALVAFVGGFWYFYRAEERYGRG